MEDLLTTELMIEDVAMRWGVGESGGGDGNLKSGYCGYADLVYNRERPSRAALDIEGGPRSQQQQQGKTDTTMATNIELKTSMVRPLLRLTSDYTTALSPPEKF